MVTLAKRTSWSRSYPRMRLNVWLMLSAFDVGPGRLFTATATVPPWRASSARATAKVAPSLGYTPRNTR